MRREWIVRGIGIIMVVIENIGLGNIEVEVDSVDTNIMVVGTMVGVVGMVEKCIMFGVMNGKTEKGHLEINGEDHLKIEGNLEVVMILVETGEAEGNQKNEPGREEGEIHPIVKGHLGPLIETLLKGGVSIVQGEIPETLMKDPENLTVIHQDHITGLVRVTEVKIGVGHLPMKGRKFVILKIVNMDQFLVKEIDVNHMVFFFI